MKNEKIVVSKTAHSQRLKSFRTSAALMLTTLMLVVAATTGATAQTFTTFDAPAQARARMREPTAAASTRRGLSRDTTLTGVLRSTASCALPMAR